MKRRNPRFNERLSVQLAMSHPLAGQEAVKTVDSLGFGALAIDQTAGYVLGEWNDISNFSQSTPRKVGTSTIDVLKAIHTAKRPLQRLGSCP